MPFNDKQCIALPDTQPSRIRVFWVVTLSNMLIPELNAFIFKRQDGLVQDSSFFEDGVTFRSPSPAANLSRDAEK